MEQSSQTTPARRQRRPWTEEDQRQAEEMQAQGFSYHAIGKTLNRDHKTVSARLDVEARNKRIERQSNFKWTEADQKSAEQMRANGLSYAAIGRNLGRCKEAIRCRLNPKAAELARRWEKSNGHRYRKRNPEKVRLAQKRWRERNKERARQVTERWRDRNRAKVREINRARDALRRSARRSSILPLTSDDKEKRFLLFNGCCAYCGVADLLTVDHVLPLSAGGLEEPQNIVPACRYCNSSKHVFMVEDWYRRQPFFTEERWGKIQRHCPAAVVGQLPLALAS